MSAPAAAGRTHRRSPTAILVAVTTTAFLVAEIIVLAVR